SRAEIKAESKQIPAEMEVEIIELPPMEAELAIPDNLIAEADVQELNEIAYKVTIISNGLRVAPEKETLVEEIEEKIDRLGGLINKVDQGFRSEERRVGKECRAGWWAQRDERNA